MYKCVICNNEIRKKDSVMTTTIVCSLECKNIRKTLLPKRLSIFSKQYWINKGYSSDEATSIVSTYQKKNSPRCVEYWINKGYSTTDATAQVAQHQSLIGKCILNRPKIDRQKSTPFSPMYWINKGYSIEEATRIVKQNSDTCSLSYYIKKYGEIEGTQKYEDMCSNRKKHYTLSGYIEKYGEELGTTKWRKKFTHRPNSKKADTFFREILNELLENTSDYKIYTAITEYGEYGLVDIKNNNYYFYDFVIPELKLCIEYNGDYWHGHPKKYDRNFFNSRRNMMVGDIWEYDDLKVNHIKNVRNFNVLIVWESDDKIVAKENIKRYINEFTETKNC